MNGFGEVKVDFNSYCYIASTSQTIVIAISRVLIVSLALYAHSVKRDEHIEIFGVVDLLQMSNCMQINDRS